MIIDKSKQHVENKKSNLSGGEKDSVNDWSLIPLNKDSCSYIKEGDLILASRVGGRIIDIKKDCELNRYVNENGYLIVHLNGKAVLIHRLVALAWLGQPSESAWIVNHKDGDKTNNDVENLEWCDFRHNIIHAYQSGLRYDNRPVKCKDLKTGEIYHFYSLGETARFFDCRPKNVYNWLNSKPKVINGRFVIADEDKEFPNLTLKDVKRDKKLGHFRYYTITNKETKEVKHFPNSQEVADFLGVHERTVRRKHKSGALANGWKIEDLTDPDICKKFKDEWLQDKNFSFRKPVPVDVYDLTNEKFTHYEGGVGEFAEQLGVKKETVQKGMFVNGTDEEGFSRWRTYLIKYLSDK